LRLLPPSWNILRYASPQYPGVDERIGPADDVLLLPLLSHRDPRLWDAPDEFRPGRWDGLDPETHPGYLPFGHVSERCWGRHMVLPLAERVLDIVRRDGYTVDPAQRVGRVELDGLLEVASVRVLHP
jgi:cytochrome P450